GVEILEYAPHNAYICRFEPFDLDSIRNLDYVEWANVYMKGFKIAPKLRASAGGPRASLLALSSVETSMAREPVDVVAALHQNAPMEKTLAKIAAAARLDASALRCASDSVRLTIQPQYLEKLAEIDEIRHIEESFTPKLLNNVAIGILGADATHEQTMMEGEGEIVAVCDTGFDKGDVEDVHPAFQGRVLKLYGLGRESASDFNGHGTHVAGSVLGDGVSSSMGGRIRGAAPKAGLVFQSLLNGWGGLSIPQDLKTLFEIPYEEDAARIHTNSWGFSSSSARATVSARQVDEFAWGHRDLVICFAAGNEAEDGNADGVVDSGSVLAPGTAKNCITVGATESKRPEQSKAYGEEWPSYYPAEPLASDQWADNPDGVAAFSGRGPTADGRIKPDVVAPGTAILSARSRKAQEVDLTWGKSSDPLYYFEGGTSMATPLVAGCAAIVRQYLRTRLGQSPGAALVKAMLINGARDIPGQYAPSEAGSIPNNAEGFGRVDLAASVGLNGDDIRVISDENTRLDTGEEETTEVEISGGDAGLKVTLAWIDPKGECLQNDLDLIVRAEDGQERHGNAHPSSSEFDRTNNVEQVAWDNPPVGKFEIIVRAHRVALHTQPYALVARIS
ncbi:MAG: S8 family serine peptidase, partial [Desulfobacterales bacterium]|nr:S8 family serine peptidase [Desulfobacterales bacterium]